MGRDGAMTFKQVRTAMRVAMVAATACGVALSMVDRASARDDGVLEFLTSAFGGAGAASGPSYPADDQPYRDRPLTVRPRRVPRLAVAAVPVKPEKVSIRDDTTLRRGDAVMTETGMRIFVGSTTGPHTSEDFVDLAKSDHVVSKTTEKVLADFDRRPGG